jgi:hypothetical protein
MFIIIMTLGQVEMEEGQVLCEAGQRIHSPSVYLVKQGCVRVELEDGTEVYVDKNREHFEENREHSEESREHPEETRTGGLVSSQLSLVAAFTRVTVVTLCTCTCDTCVTLLVR